MSCFCSLQPGEGCFFVGLAYHAALGRIVEELVGPGHGLMVGEAPFDHLGEASFSLAFKVWLDAFAVLEGDAERGECGSGHVHPCCCEKTQVKYAIKLCLCTVFCSVASRTYGVEPRKSPLKAGRDVGMTQKVGGVVWGAPLE